MSAVSRLKLSSSKISRSSPERQPRRANFAVPGARSLATNGSFRDITLKAEAKEPGTDAFPVRDDWGVHKGHFRAGQIRPGVQPLSDKAMKLMGVTKEQVARSRALNRMGLTEDDVDSAESVWKMRRNQEDLLHRKFGANAGRAVRQLGHEPTTLLAGKALRHMGVSASEFDEGSAMILAGMGYSNKAGGSPAREDAGESPLREEPASPPTKMLPHSEFRPALTRGGAGSFVTRGRASSPIPGARARAPGKEALRPGSRDGGAALGPRARSRSVEKPAGRRTHSIDISSSFRAVPLSPQPHDPERRTFS